MAFAIIHLRCIFSLFEDATQTVRTAPRHDDTTVLIHLGLDKQERGASTILAIEAIQSLIHCIIFLSYLL